MLTHLRSAQNCYLGWLDYFGYHALDLLGNSLCNTRLIYGVYHFYLQDLFGVEDRGIFFKVVILDLHGLEYMKGDLVSWGSQFQFSLLPINQCLTNC